MTEGPPLSRYENFEASRGDLCRNILRYYSWKRPPQANGSLGSAKLANAVTCRFFTGHYTGILGPVRNKQHISVVLIFIITSKTPQLSVTIVVCGSFFKRIVG